ncbi:ran-binding protein [Xylariaceae sp. FL0594]|nr:ran-binding protein [Xylariaceae sp. FL0594]
MANPFQLDSSGTNPDGTYQGFRAGPPYASVVSGSNLSLTSQSIRSNRLSYLLNPANESASDPSTLPPSRSSMLDPDLNDPSPGGAGCSPAPRPPQLPSFSRVFGLFMPAASPDDQLAKLQNKAFFVPSYLKGSSYERKLEDLHKTRQSNEESQLLAAGSTPTTAATVSLGLKPPASHLGMTYDLIERNPIPAQASTVPPLPSRWNVDDKHGPLLVSSNGLEVKYNPTAKVPRDDSEMSGIRADHPMPVVAGIYYFEVTILSKRRDEYGQPRQTPIYARDWHAVAKTIRSSSVCIGFVGKHVALSRAPGWEPESWGFHGDDGDVYSGGNVGTKYRDTTFNAHDVIGCAVNFRTGQAFFTKNGVNLGTAFRDIKGKVYPVVGMKKPGEQIRANFGQSPFVYKIDQVIENERSQIQAAIARTSVERLVSPPLNETELIQKLVMQFLQHDGYIETARELADEIYAEQKALSNISNTPVTSISVKDNEDAYKRQRIRRAILEGDIDRALKFTDTYYPHVLGQNQDVYFNLRCRKFIEMVRKAAEYSNNSGKMSNGHSYDDMPNEMDIDENDTSANAEFESLDPETDAGALLQKTIQYGQALQAEFKHDPRPEIGKALKDIFALMAYPDPLQIKEFAPMLDRRGRTAVAEELNSAILSSLGKSSRSALENLCGQTSVLLDYLRENGGPGSLVSIQSIIDEIPKPQQY